MHFPRRARVRAVLASLALLFGVLLAGASASASTRPTPGPAAITVGATASVPATPILTTGLDLHDGTVVKSGSTYVEIGTEYGCGYTWYVSSHWCGFGASTAPSLSGPWSAPVLLFPPSAVDPYTGQTYDQECGLANGHGCFEPRIWQRTDGVWILYFNYPDGRTSSTTSAIYALGCNSVTGPCGASAGAPYGSTHKPTLHQCNGTNGSVALAIDSTGPVIFCAYGHISEERLDTWWTNGTGVGTANVAIGEGEGVYQDPATGTWIMTYSDQLCGYCTGTPLAYATAPSLLGPWTTVTSLAQGNYGTPDARAWISANTCGGQSSTVFAVDGQEYQRIDLWTGSASEPGANTLFEPLNYTGAPTGSAGDAQPWTPPFDPFTC